MLTQPRRVFAALLALAFTSCDAPTEALILIPASIVAVGGDEQEGVVGQALPLPLVASVVDSAGRPVPNQVVHFLVIEGGGSVVSPSVQTDDEGRVRQTWILGTSVADSHVVEARVSVPGASAIITVRFRATPKAGAASALQKASADSQQAIIMSAVPIAPSVRAVDQFGNPVSGVAVTFSITEGNGSITTANATTGSNGVASVGGWILGATGGSNRLQALSPGLAGSPVGFVATAIPALRATSLTVGIRFACALTASGQAYCWGANAAGQLGDGSRADRSVAMLVSGGLTFSSISAGLDHVCAVTPSGQAYCWGANSRGALGINTTDSSSVPVAVSGGLTFRNVSAGASNTCAVATGNAGYCWGADNEGGMAQGKLGTGTFGDRLVPTIVAGGIAFSRISTTAEHSCGLSTTGSAYCWGFNFYGQVGIPPSTIPQASPQAVAGGLTFSSIEVGDRFSCALDAAGKAYCWGRNDLRQLGSNVSQSGTSVPTPVDGNLAYAYLRAPPTATATSSGSGICGVDAAGRAYCWGNTSSGGGPWPGPTTAISGVYGEATYPVHVKDFDPGPLLCYISASDVVYCVDSTGSASAVRLP